MRQGGECTRSTLSQPFAVSSIVTVSARGFLLSNEFPTFTSSNSTFNDRYVLQLSTRRAERSRCSTSA